MLVAVDYAWVEYQSLMNQGKVATKKNFQNRIIAILYQSLMNQGKVATPGYDSRSRGGNRSINPL